jgi:hypothetical protein
MIDAVIDHVLAETLGAAALEVHDRGQPLEPGRDLLLVALEGVAVDLQREIGK